jgi:hypothetical protein
LIGLASGFDAYLSGVYVGRIRSLWQYFYAPLMEQWIWAALTPAVFVRIQERRFDRLLTSVFDVAPEALDAAVPTLLLQPHVENAVVHGVALRVETGPRGGACRQMGRQACASGHRQRSRVG